MEENYTKFNKNDINQWYPLIEKDARQYTHLPRHLQDNPDVFYECVRRNHEVLNFMGHTKGSHLTADFLNPYVDLYGKDVLVEIPRQAACWKDSAFIDRCLSVQFIPNNSDTLFHHIANHDIKMVRTVLAIDTRQNPDQERQQFDLIRTIYQKNNPYKGILHAEIVQFVEQKLDYQKKETSNRRSVGVVYGIPAELLALDSIFYRCVEVVDYYQVPQLYQAGMQDDQRLQHMLTSEGVNISSFQRILSHESDGKERLNLYGRILALYPKFIAELQDNLETNKVIDTEIRQKQIAGHVCIMAAYAFHSGDNRVIDDFTSSHPAYEAMTRYLEERYEISDKVKEQEVDIYL